MQGMINNIQGMNTSLNAKMASMQDSLLNLKTEMAAMKADMVTKEIFQNLETRVAALEAKGFSGENSSETVWMQQQMGRLDPANKSLFFKGLAQQNTKTRADILRGLVRHCGEEAQISNIEHLWTGSPGNRVISPNCVVEFSSRAIRETVLEKLGKENSPMTAAANLSCNRAKTSIQLKRNGSLKKAAELLKKDARCKSKSVNIAWKQDDGTKDRSVEVDGKSIFKQQISDLAGSFESQFHDLSF
jgi:hypothetical protein